MVSFYSSLALREYTVKATLALSLITFSYNNGLGLDIYFTALANELKIYVLIFLNNMCISATPKWFDLGG